MSLVDGLKLILMVQGERELNNVPQWQSGKNKKAFGLLIFFFLSLLVTAILPEARLGCTEAYFKN